MKLSGRGPSVLDYDLEVGTSEEPVAVDFGRRIVRLCLECPAYLGRTGADGKRFIGKACDAPTSCIPPGSPSGAFVDD